MTATYVLIHGAGDVGWYWHMVEAELRVRGHEVVVMDLPVDDDSAGLSTYADVVVEAIGDHDNLVVVAQSFGGYIAPIVCDRVPVRLLVLVAAMVPAPGESAEAMFTNTGYAPAEQGDSSDLAIFYHDVDPTLAAEALAKGRWQPGLTSPRDTCCVATIASFLRRGSVASCEIGLASSPTRSTAVIPPRSATQASWSGASRRTGPI
jgi:pimeloyl-ACP methyl ester carboxylesterase